MAGNTVVSFSNVSITANDGGTPVTIGTVGNPVNSTNSTVTLFAASYSSGAILSLATMPNSVNNVNLSDTSLYRGKTGNVVNAQADDEFSVPVAVLQSLPNNIGTIMAKITFDNTKMDFIRLEGSDFTAQLAGTNEIRIEKTISDENVISVTDPFTFKLDFKLKAAQSDNSTSNINITQFKVYPIVNGTVDDNTYQDLAPLTQTITFIDAVAISSAYISNSASGSEISQIAANGTNTLYAVKDAIEPAYPVSYTYEWYSSADEFKTPIATGASYKPQDSDVGNYLKVKVSMVEEGNASNILCTEFSDTVLINPSKNPSVVVNNLQSPNGFAAGQEVYYDYTITKAYPNGVINETYQWDYESSPDVWSPICFTKNLTISPTYMNKKIMFRVTATETINNVQTLYTGFKQFALDSTTVTKPTTSSATLVYANNAPITTARDGETVKVNYSLVTQTRLQQAQIFNG